MCKAFVTHSSEFWSNVAGAVAVESSHPYQAPFQPCFHRVVPCHWAWLEELLLLMVATEGQACASVESTSRFGWFRKQRQVGGEEGDGRGEGYYHFPNLILLTRAVGKEFCDQVRKKSNGKSRIGNIFQEGSLNSVSQDCKRDLPPSQAAPPQSTHAPSSSSICRQ